MIIAIDGPSGSGKSTVAKQLASKLNCLYIDSGAMFRALTWYFLKENISDELKVEAELKKINIIPIENGINLNGFDLTSELRTTEIDKNVSYFSSLKSIRSFLLDVQRKISLGKDIIMDGRDIGTVVFPDADYKFFLDASARVRAERRKKERGESLSTEKIEEEIKRRDKYDSSRKIAPLKRADDAILIDTSKLTINEVICKIIEKIK